MNEVETFFDKCACSWDKNECHSIEEKKYLLDKVDIKQNSKILDIACGTGVITRLLHEYSNSVVKGIDISQNMIDIAKKKYQLDSWAIFEKCDFINLKEQNYYDYAIIYNAYPHFLDTDAFAKKLSEVLKKGGKFAILHSLSRYELQRHHSGRAVNVSRTLNAPLIESKVFEPYFDIIEASETEHTFVLIGRKK